MSKSIPARTKEYKNISEQNMENLGLGYGVALPVTNGYGVYSRKDNNKAIHQHKYLPIGQSLTGVALSQRNIQPFSTGSTYYQNHTYNVGLLLQQRKVLNYQYNKLQALMACMYCGAAIMNKLPALQQSLQNNEVLPFINEGDLLYREFTGVPLSFSQNSGSVAPHILQPALTHLQNTSGQMMKNARAMVDIFRPWVNSSLSMRWSQIQQNNRYLSFQGYPAPELTYPEPIVYPFDQLQQWLTTSTLSNSVPPLRGYLAHQPNLWPSTSQLFFTPSMNNTNLRKVFISQAHNSSQTVKDNKIFSQLNQHFNAFKYPLPLVGYEQEKPVIYSLPSSSVTLKNIEAQDKCKRDQIKEQKSKKLNAIQLVEPSPLPSNTMLASSIVTDDSKLLLDNELATPIGRCVAFMQEQLHGKRSQRQALTELFNSWEGQVLFGKGDHLQGQSLLKSSPFDKPQDYSSEDINIDHKSALIFIDLYFQLVQGEEKPDKVESAQHSYKKLERLDALKEIRKFVQNLDPQSQGSAKRCRLALQMCGRVRERSLVKQRGLPFCGGFSILQSAWGKRPLMMTKIILSLELNKCYHVRTLVPNEEKILTVPPSLDLSFYSEALADKLILSTLYDFNDRSSTAARDAVNASFLGISARIFDQDGDLLGNQKEINKKFIQALCQASQQKCPIRAAITGKLYDFIDINLLQGEKRKANKDDVLDIEMGVNKTDENQSTQHAVLFDNFKEEKDSVVFKIYTWGRVYYLKMKTDTFLQYIVKNSFVVFDQKTTVQNTDIFKDMNVEVLDKKNDKTGIILSLSGKEIKVPQGETKQGFGKKKYTYKGNSSWNVYKGS